MKDNLVDRGIGTVLDGYSTDAQLASIVNTFLERRTHEGLRDRLAFLVGHFGLMRGENVRALELADISALELPNEGPTPCTAMVTLLDHGKTDKDGRVELAAAMRSKNVETCCHDALAFYLFSRFQVDNELFPPHDTTFPSLARPRDWYGLKLLRSNKTAHDEISYDKHLESVNRAFNAVGLHTKAKTHAMRGSGSRMADLNGAAEGDIRRAGRWNQQVMERCYLTTLPRQTMRSLAGFRPEGGTYFVARDIEVPEVLLAQVFPDAVEWTRKHEAGEGCERNMATSGFLKLLLYLRRVLIQDAAILRSSHPSHPLFRHALFDSAEFRSFEDTMKRHLEEHDDPLELRLRLAMPQLTSRLDTQFAAVHQTMTALATGQEQLVRLVTTHAVATSDFVRDASSGKVPIVLNASSDALVALPASTSAAAAAASGSRAPQPANPAPPAPVSLKFTLQRNISSVDELWREFDLGLAGQPSVKSVCEGANPAKLSETEGRFYRRRRTLIREVERLSAQHKLDERVVVAAVDRLRLSLPNNSLAKLADHLKEVQQLDIVPFLASE